MTNFDKDWLSKVARLVATGRYTELDIELQAAAIDYSNLANRLHELSEELAISEDVTSLRDALQGVLTEVETRGSIQELSDAIRGEQRIEDVPEHRRRTIWAHGDLWFASRNASDVLERAKKVVARVVLQESILPDSCPRDLDEVRVKFDGEVWEIHQNDPDPRPSDPHAHLGRSTKLDLRNGDLYNKASFLNDWLSKKDLEHLRSLFEKKGVKMPELDYKTSKRAI